MKIQPAPTWEEVLELREKSEFHETLDTLLAHRVYVDKPAKPYVGAAKTSAELLAAAHKMAAYEKEKAEYDEQSKQCKIHNTTIEVLVRQLVGYEACIEIVPEKYRDKLWNLATSNGLSSGYHEVYYNLEKLVEIFN